ncbi:hypothetical protein [Nocardia abscessus]|uniref:hypothetical protein n=1 Tax=Nocardia abscessus TaxID=120957 RepID=UPI00031E3D2D|nr:hypothetical protein [Nocardia abscessus]
MPSAEVVVGIVLRSRASAEVIRAVLREPCSWVRVSSADVVVGIVLRLRASADVVRAVLREGVLMGSCAVG